MDNVTQILCAIQHGDPHAADQLLPLVYAELRRLAAQRLAQEKPGQTLQATALVHEVYLRLVDVERVQQWDGRGHFFAAAAEAMRRILIERARKRRTLKRGGTGNRLDFEKLSLVVDGPAFELLAIDEALSELERNEPQAALLVKLRFFAGLSHQDAAEAIGVSRRTADRLWTLAKAWLYRRLDST